MNNKQIQTFIEKTWDTSIIPNLMEYVHIPNKSPLFDADWQAHGHMDKAVKLVVDWCKKQDLKNFTIEVVRLANRTPVIFMEIAGESADTVLLYGHLDKQPEMSGWDMDLAPWKPVLRDGKLYGRGAADDGYAAFASVTAIKALQEQQIPHARCVILIETCEESGSYDLPFYIDALDARIGNPSLVICLDSGCGNYDQLWMTTSLRGVLGGSLLIEVLKQGVHSGLGSGIVPSCFLVLHQLLDRLENSENGFINLAELHVEIPQQRIDQAAKAADVLGHELVASYPLAQDTRPISDDNVELILNRTWRPTMSVTGIDGFPAIKDAGNVTLPQANFKLSMRLPPTCDAATAANAVKNLLENDPPFNARVIFSIEQTASGWNAPQETQWLIKAADEASQLFFGKDACYMGEGGSIPFMGMLGKKFPEAQFLITGVLGPASNAHGPNEFLHIQMGKNVTCCVAKVIADHYKREKN